MTTLYRLQGLPAAHRQQRERTAGHWRRHPHVKKFLSDHYPLEWARIQDCGRRAMDFKSETLEDTYTFTPNSCRVLPFCTRCIIPDASRKVGEALEDFQKCTPPGQPPLFYPFVQTAPNTEDNQGWGYPASKKIGAFGSLVNNVFTEGFGPGLGIIMSYQDFGERGPRKRHPHMDGTLNGYQLIDGEMQEVQPYDFKGNGRRIWGARVMARAQAFQLGARDGNIQIKHRYEGVASVRSIMYYKFREMWDLRKIEYSRDARTIWWNSYKHNLRTKYTVNEFKAMLGEYQWRLGAWKAPREESMAGTQRLHRRYGHMADTSIERTQATIGAPDPLHRKACKCKQCHDWQRVFIEDHDRHALGQPWKPA